jgi:hypothetical protein
MASIRLSRPGSREITLAGIALLVLVGGAFVAAALAQNLELFSRFPPGQPTPDIEESNRLFLYQTFFTAWAALLLVTPALCTFWFRRSSERAARYWLAFWSASYVAFLIHLYWAIFVFFGGDWGRIFGTTRVSAPIPDLLLAAWWGADLLLGWLALSETILVRIQRGLVHLLAFVLFFAGSALEGEIPLSRSLGFLMGGAVLISFLLWLLRWRRARGVT